MNIFITGVSGFLGRQLAAHFARLGHTVLGSSRRPVEALEGVRGVQLALGEPFDPSVFDGVDVVIHAAHDFTRGAEDLNVRGIREWFLRAGDSGARQLFLSSYSARADATSEYGRTKYRIEQLFLEGSQTALRVGLVIGDGGLFQKQRRALLRAPIVPVLGKGDQPTAVIALSHFVEATASVVERREPRAYGLFYSQQASLREFVTSVKRHAGQRARILEISPGLAMKLVSFASALGLPLPVGPDQIRTLSLNESAPFESDLPLLLPGRDSEFRLDYALSVLPGMLGQLG